jgi:hypothetical protein
MASGKAQFRVGDVVTHKKFGKGDILDVYPLGEDTCAVVSFEKSGQKKIILKYANLELVSRAKGEPEPKAEVGGRQEEEVVVDVDADVEGAAEPEEEEEEEEEDKDKGDDKS